MLVNIPAPWVAYGLCQSEINPLWCDCWHFLLMSYGPDGPLVHIIELKRAVHVYQKKVIRYNRQIYNIDRQTHRQK
jgi:hypothetical protein